MGVLRHFRPLVEILTVCTSQCLSQDTLPSPFPIASLSKYYCSGLVTRCVAGHPPPQYTPNKQHKVSFISLPPHLRSHVPSIYRHSYFNWKAEKREAMPTVECLRVTFSNQRVFALLPFQTAVLRASFAMDGAQPSPGAPAPRGRRRQRRLGCCTLAWGVRLSCRTGCAFRCTGSGCPGPT